MLDSIIHVLLEEDGMKQTAGLPILAMEAMVMTWLLDTGGLKHAHGQSE